MKYIVTWNEKRSITVDAKSKDEAIELANMGSGSDETAEMEGGFEVEEV